MMIGQLPSTNQRGGKILSTVIDRTMPLGLTLKNIFDKNNMRKVDILINADVSRSFVDRLFRGKESRFDLVLSIVRYLECDENTLMDQYCDEITQADNFLYAMEYADRRNKLDLLEKLFKRSQDQTLPELLEMRNLYSLSLKRKKDGCKENLEKILYKVKTFETTSLLARTFQKFVETQIYYELKEYGNVRGNLRELNISKIEDSFFRESFQWRLNQVHQSITLRFQANFKESRELAFKLLKISDSKYFHAFSYGNLGLSYAFENDDKAISYLNASELLYRETGMANLIWNETIEFIKILWGQPIKVEEIKSLQNLSFKLIKEGKYYQALEILDKLDEVEGKSPLRLYLRGLATNNEDYHWQSLEMYIRDRGDRLFAILPRNELIHLKQNKNGVNALYNIIISKSR
jgi:hypothetical protein